MTTEDETIEALGDETDDYMSNDTIPCSTVVMLFWVSLAVLYIAFIL